MQVAVRDDTRSAVGGPVCFEDRISEKIAEKVGQQKYKIWFENSVRLNLCEDFLKVAVANLFIANWIEGRFAKQISAAAKEVTGEEKKLTFVIDAAVAGHRRGVSIDGHSSVERKAEELAGPAVRSRPPRSAPKFTLDSYVVGNSNQVAYNAALSVIRDDKVSFNPLFVHGGYGVGKTHLLQGICNAVSRNRPGTVWLYLSAEDFVNQFVLALKTKKLEAFRHRMRQTDLLAIDDIHFLASKPSTQEEFLHTFNSIDLAGRQVVLASDAHPKLIRELSEKLVNRFISGMVVKIECPDFQTRCQIIRQFAVAKSVSIPEAAVKYVAENLRSSVRELEGAVLKVAAYSAVQGRSIELGLTKEILAEHLARMDPVVHITDIEAAVAGFFSLTPADLHSTRKDRTASLARHFSMYLARKLTKMSTPEIGRSCGNKNHATVIVACRQVEAMLSQNQQMHWQSPAGNRVAKAKTILATLENIIAG
jgi:chromosomal replication initiator protein